MGAPPPSSWRRSRSRPTSSSPARRRCTSTSWCRRSPPPAWRIVGWDDLDAVDRKRMTEVYEQRIFPVLTPLAVDPSHPFPYISDLALSVGAMVANPDPEQRRPPLRPGQGPDRLPAPVRGRRAPLHPRRGAHHRPPPHPLLGDGGGGGGGVPRHPQRRPHAGGRGGRGPPRSAGDGAAPAPVQQGGAPRGLRPDERRDARSARRRAGDPRRTTSTAAGPRSTSASCGSCTASTGPTSRTGRGRR